MRYGHWSMDIESSPVPRLTPAFLYYMCGKAGVNLYMVVSFPDLPTRSREEVVAHFKGFLG